MRDVPLDLLVMPVKDFNRVLPILELSRERTAPDGARERRAECRVVRVNGCGGDVFGGAEAAACTLRTFSKCL